MTKQDSNNKPIIEITPSQGVGEEAINSSCYLCVVSDIMSVIGSDKLVPVRGKI